MTIMTAWPLQQKAAREHARVERREKVISAYLSVNDYHRDRYWARHYRRMNRAFARMHRELDG
jgi:hypothetical protein